MAYKHMQRDNYEVDSSSDFPVNKFDLYFFNHDFKNNPENDVTSEFDLYQLVEKKNWRGYRRTCWTHCGLIEQREVVKLILDGARVSSGHLAYGGVVYLGYALEITLRVEHNGSISLADDLLE